MLERIAYHPAYLDGAMRALEFAITLKETRYPKRELLSVVRSTTNMALHIWLDTPTDVNGCAATSALLSEIMYEGEASVDKHRDRIEAELSNEQLEEWRSQIAHARDVIGSTGVVDVGWQVLKWWLGVIEKPF